MDFLRPYLERVPVETFIKVVAVVTPLLVVLVLGTLAIEIVGRAAGVRSGNKKQRVRIRQVMHITKYIFVAVVLLIGAFSFAGSWTGLGVSLGVIAAAAGFALQRPAASVAAWLTILVKKPFIIGDRIMIGTIARGDVTDITLTHIYLAEVGRYGAEDLSGRTITVPNNVIFELPVTRYGDGDNKVLGEVELTVTYASNIKKARELAEKVVLDVSGFDARAHTRVKLKESGVGMEIRYDVQVAKANRVASEISEGILNAFLKEKDVELAYNRMDVQLVEKRGRK